MATDTTALYESILQLIPVDELKDSYNVVLSEEISRTNRTVNDIVAAFAKLQEVRKAVRQLQQESIGTRSRSLTETMDATLEMQKKLNETVDLVVTEMTKACGKRKTTETCGNESRKKLLKTEVKSGGIVQTTQGKMKSFQEMKRKEENSLTTELDRSSGDENVKGISPWASGLDTTSCQETLRNMTRLSADERNKHLSGVLSKLAEFMPSYRDKASILKHVIVWVEQSVQNGDNLAVYDHFCNDTRTMINKCPQREAKIELQRLNNSLNGFLNKSENGSTKGIASPKRTFHRSYELLVWRVNAMDLDERAKHIPEVFKSLENEMFQDASKWEKKNEAGNLAKSLAIVRLWGENLPKESCLRKLFGDLVEHMQPIMDKISNFKKKTRIYSEMISFQKIAGITPSERGQPRAQMLLKNVKQLNGKSRDAIDTCIFLLGDVLLHRESDWKPLSDPIVKECYDRLVKIVSSSPKDFSKQRTNILEKWMGIRTTS